MDDSRIVDSLDRKDQSFGTGCDDHAVRLLFFDKLRSYLTVHHDLNAILLAAMDVAADHVRDVTFSWRICSKSHVSAENISCLIKCYFMASLLCDKCSRKSCNTTTDNHNLLWLLSFLKRLCLMTQERVCQTAYRISCIHVCNAALKTGDTRSHIIKTLFLCFLRHSRICKALTPECHKVSSSFFYHQLCELWLCITSNCDHRDIYRTFDLFNLCCGKSTVDNGRCPHKLILDMNSTGYMKSVQSTAFQICCDRCTVVDIKSARNLVCTVDSCKNCNFSLCCFFNFLNDQTGETHTVLKTSAKLIHSLVCSRRKEGTYQITVCHMDFNSICSCFHCSSCCLTVAFDQLVNFLSCKLLRNITSAYRRNAGCCCDRCSCVLCISLRTCVLKLDGHLCSFCMTSVDDLAEAFDRSVVVKTWFTRAALCAFVNYSSLDGDQTKSAFCSFSVICSGLLTHCSVCVCKVISHWRNNKTVLYCHRTDLDRLKHRIEFHMRSPFL